MYLVPIIYPRVSLFGESLLVRLAETGEVEAARKLIERGAIVNVTLQGYTPLTMACVAGNGDFIEMILQHGVDINVTEPLYGRTPLTMLAAMTNEAALIGMRALLNHGALVNALDGASNTPLVVATLYGNIKGVELLLSYGANPNIGLEDGWSALSSSRDMESWCATNDTLPQSLRAFRMWNEVIDIKEELKKYQQISAMLLNHGARKTETTR
jgi:ankyrin repeat protein